MDEKNRGDGGDGNGDGGGSKQEDLSRDTGDLHDISPNDPGRDGGGGGDDSS